MLKKKLRLNRDQKSKTEKTEKQKNGKIFMKINRKLLAVSIVAALAVSARADTWLNNGPDAITVQPGQSGTSVFTFEETAGAAETLPVGSAWMFSEVSYVSGHTTYSSSEAPPSGAYGIFSSFNLIGTSLAGTTFNPLNGDITAGGNVAIGVPFTMTVSWTIGNVEIPGTVNSLEAGFQNGTPTGNETASGQFTIASVPEPAQTIAGAMLLGCGGLVFAGRRMFKKTAA